MTTISAKMIKDSVSPDGIRIRSILARYPLPIHGEFMTHRVFSRNASSNRAIPTPRLLADVTQDPFMPLRWLQNEPGMQGYQELPQDEQDFALRVWTDALYGAVNAVKLLDGREFKLHKQYLNRLIGPFQHINVLFTTTSMANFVGLRDHHAAMPEIQEVARSIVKASDESEPQLLQPGEWHLPWIEEEDWLATNHLNDDDQIDVLRKVSTARCARTSYMTFEGKRSTIEEDVPMHDKLVGSDPKHASPAEHQATPDTKQKGIVRAVYPDGLVKFVSPYTGECTVDTIPGVKILPVWDHEPLHGNFDGWNQYRKMIPGEYIKD